MRAGFPIFVLQLSTGLPKGGVPPFGRVRVATRAARRGLNAPERRPPHPINAGSNG